MCVYVCGCSYVCMCMYTYTYACIYIYMNLNQQKDLSNLSSSFSHIYSFKLVLKSTLTKFVGPIVSLILDRYETTTNI